ncbi:thioredoxin domain-containing protein [Pseudonocardia sp. NPDC049154]|uniref:thioredoxin domain-containing protein n=1 Tax=Pseudonocardia sp. NPDC049154 TaxID=3155501 RepID=UPI0033D8ABD4
MVDLGRPDRWRFCRSGDLHRRLAARGLTLEVSPAALVHIARAGYDPVYGARPLRRYIAHVAETRIARALLRDAVPDGGTASPRSRASFPVLVDFWATWCGPCRLVSPALEQLATERAGVITIVKVDVDRTPALGQRFRIPAVPTLLVLRGGEVAARQAGAGPVAELRRRLDDALAEPKPSEEKEPS